VQNNRLQVSNAQQLLIDLVGLKHRNSEEACASCPILERRCKVQAPFAAARVIITSVWFTATDRERSTISALGSNSGGVAILTFIPTSTIAAVSDIIAIAQISQRQTVQSTLESSINQLKPDRDAPNHSKH